ncbi:MAG: DUF4279 domain-containing protein [Comamonas sp.]
MAHLERSVATLRIMGDDLVPEEISRLLGAVPTSAHAKGHQYPLEESGRLVTRKSGVWRLRAREAQPEDLDGQVSELLGLVTSNLSVWGDLTNRFRVDMFCGWFMGSANEGVQISSGTLLALGQRRIMLSVDIYGPNASDVDHGETHV